MANELVSGQQYTWNLLRKLGEGDAGEVFQVETLAGGLAGILKRPRKSAFAGDMFRQSAQIRTEAKILKALAGAIDKDSGIGVPVLLDQSKPESDFNAHNFIVIEAAAGIDLATIGRVAQLGLNTYEEQLNGPAPSGQTLLQFIANNGSIPTRILLTILLRLALFLEKIHAFPSTENGAETSGIIWNDVKPDHLFWDVEHNLLTVIDWGNARFLEADRATIDRQFSWADDFRQYFEEMGRFINNAAPELHASLGWPVQFNLEQASPEAIEGLSFRLVDALKGENTALAAARESEAALLSAVQADDDGLSRLEVIQNEILSFGELPDLLAALRFASGYAAQLAVDDRLEDLRRLSTWAVNLPGSDGEQWRLVSYLARIPGRSEGLQRKHFLDAIQFAICKDWENLLWEVAAGIQGYPEPDWWQELTILLRRLALGPEGDGIRPLVGVRRLTLSLQAAARRIEDSELSSEAGAATARVSLDRYQVLARRLREDVIDNWLQVDPGPPDSRLDYAAIEPYLTETAELLPNEQRAIRSLLANPKNQVKRIMDAWAGQDFLEASQGLRRLLLWDPDRWRVLRADRAIQTATEYLNTIRFGPRPEDNFPQWITMIEFRGREMRNQVGPAGWLDGILDSCKQIRKGVWPADLLKTNPSLLREMPWLARFERSECVPVLVDEKNQEPTSPAAQAAPTEIHGVVDGWLGPEGSVALIEPLDAWMPEARGSSARVVDGLLLGPDNLRHPAAIKLMRMDQVHYALPLFREEAVVLNLMKDIPGVSRLLECGFFKLDEGGQFPLISAAEAPLATGRVLRIGPDATREYLDRLEERIESGWTPYLAIEKRAKEDSLLMLCDAGMVRGQYMPMVTLLQMAIQICDILQIAHQKNIVYRDHKILHYYWQSENNGLYMIDWNVARYHSDGLTEHELHMDLVQFGARGLHHILTGRTAPGALPLGPTRPEEIDQAADTYKTQWTYDDQRLSDGLRGLIERVLAGEYRSASDLGADLKRTMMQLPDARLAEK